MNTESEVESLLGAYALDAVDDLERERVERYLQQTPRARAEVDRHIDVAAALGNSAGPAPASVWDRIEAQIGAKNSATSTAASLAAVPSATEPTPGESTTTAPTTAPTTPTPTTPLANARPSNADTHQVVGTRHGDTNVVALRRPKAMWMSGMAASVIGAVAFAGIGLNQSRRADRLEASLAEAQQTITEVRNDSAATRQKVVSLETELVSASTPAAQARKMLAAPNAQVVNLVSGQTPMARIVFNAKTGEGYLIGDQLPDLASGHTYQLWGVTKGGEKKVLSLGVFGPSPETVPFAAEGAWAAFVLTDEAGPVVSSTQPLFAAGEVTSI